MDFLSDESNKQESELIIELLNDTGLQSLEYNVCTLNILVRT